MESQRVAKRLVGTEALRPGNKKEGPGRERRQLATQPHHFSKICSRVERVAQGTALSAISHPQRNKLQIRSTLHPATPPPPKVEAVPFYFTLTLLEWSLVRSDNPRTATFLTCWGHIHKKSSQILLGQPFVKENEHRQPLKTPSIVLRPWWSHLANPLS